MKQYKYRRLNHHSNEDLVAMIENVAYMSSPLIKENRHSDVLANDRNCDNNSNDYSAVLLRASRGGGGMMYYDAAS